MAVIEADVPNGYVVFQIELDKIVASGEVPHLMNAEFEEDRVVMYFDYVSAIFCMKLCLQITYFTKKQNQIVLDECSFFKW